MTENRNQERCEYVCCMRTLIQVSIKQTQINWSESCLESVCRHEVQTLRCQLLHTQLLMTLRPQQCPDTFITLPSSQSKTAASFKDHSMPPTTLPLNRKNNVFLLAVSSCSIDSSVICLQISSKSHWTVLQFNLTHDLFYYLLPINNYASIVSLPYISTYA